MAVAGWPAGRVGAGIISHIYARVTALALSLSCPQSPPVATGDRCATQHAARDGTATRPDLSQCIHDQRPCIHSPTGCCSGTTHETPLSQDTVLASGEDSPWQVGATRCELGANHAQMREPSRITRERLRTRRRAYRRKGGWSLAAARVGHHVAMRGGAALEAGSTPAVRDEEEQ